MAQHQGWTPTDDLPPIQLLPQGPITRFLRHIFNERLTDSGRFMFWVGVISMGAGGVTLQIQVYEIFCLIAGLFLVSIALSRLARVTLKIDASVPSRTTCGTKLSLPLQVTNPTKHTAVDVVLRERKLPRTVLQYPSSGVSLPVLAAEQSALVMRELEFTRRGVYQLPTLRQETIFPWGMWKDLKDHDDARSVIVYPRFHPLTALDIPVGKRYQPGGIALSSNLGDSIEFIGTREFRQGDTIRAIHWKTWARLGKPAVKEFQEEYFCRVALLMDTFMPAPPTKRKLFQRAVESDNPTFEAAISTAAAIADALSREEYIIDIFAAGPEIYYLQSGRSLAYLENVLDILACLGPCHEPPFEKLAPVLLEQLTSITTTICIMLDWDTARERMVQVIRDHGTAVKLIVVRDSPTTLDLSSAEQLCGTPVVVLSSADIAGGVELI